MVIDSPLDPSVVVVRDSDQDDFLGKILRLAVVRDSDQGEIALNSAISP